MITGDWFGRGKPRGSRVRTQANWRHAFCFNDVVIWNLAELVRLSFGLLLLCLAGCILFASTAQTIRDWLQLPRCRLASGSHGANAGLAGRDSNRLHQRYAQESNRLRSGLTPLHLTAQWLTNHVQSSGAIQCRRPRLSFLALKCKPYRSLRAKDSISLPRTFDDSENGKKV